MDSTIDAIAGHLEWLAQHDPRASELLELLQTPIPRNNGKRRRLVARIHNLQQDMLRNPVRLKS